MEPKDQGEPLSPIPRSRYEGVLSIAEIELPCFVLETGERKVSTRGIMQGFGRTWRGRKYPGTELPVFLEAKNLKPFILNELLAVPIATEFLTLSGTIAEGTSAELVPEICDIYLRARDANALRASQIPIAIQADILMRAFAKIGIIALVDEATGYQAVREQDALTKILQAYVAAEIRKWILTFPPEFYSEMFRLRGLTYTGATKRPRYIGHLTNDLVYSRLAPGVLDELRKKNPIDADTGRRKTRHHQWLTGEFGHPRLRQHLEGVTVTMRLSRNWGEFYWRMNEIYPKLNETPIIPGFRGDDDDPKFVSQPTAN